MWPSRRLLKLHLKLQRDWLWVLRPWVHSERGLAQVRARSIVDNGIVELSGCRWCLPHEASRTCLHDECHG